MNRLSVPISVKKAIPSNGTITDIDGNFNIKVNPDATLEISFIGYKTVEVKAVAGKPLNVILKDDSEMLEEVVVVGYGTMRKKDLLGVCCADSSRQACQ